MPQRKKHATTRARRNKASTAATLHLVEPVDYSTWSIADLRGEVDDRNEELDESDQLSRPKTKAALIKVLEADDAGAIPDLPERPDGWHAQTVAWWNEVWASPMSAEWHAPSDLHNVHVCAMLYDDMWTAEKASERTRAAGEFRQQRASLGLTPYDRRRLEWTIEGADEAKARGNQRRSTTPATPSRKGKRPDPRAQMSSAG